MIKHGLVTSEVRMVEAQGAMQLIHAWPARQMNGEVVQTSIGLAMSANSGEIELLTMIVGENGMEVWTVSLTEIVHRIHHIRDGSEFCPEDLMASRPEPENCPHCRCYRSEDREPCCFCSLSHEVGQSHTETPVEG